MFYRTTAYGTIIFSSIVVAIVMVVAIIFLMLIQLWLCFDGSCHSFSGREITTFEIKNQKTNQPDRV